MTPAPPVPGSPELLAKAVASAQKEIAQETERVERASAKLLEEPLESEKQKAKETQEPAQEPEVPERENAQDPPPEPGAQEVAKIRRLADAGKIDEARSALAKLCGVSNIDKILTSKSWAAYRTEQRKQAQRVSAERAKVDADREQLNREIAQVKQIYEPLASARRAFSQGDIAAAVQYAFGMSVEEFTKAALRGKVSENPEVLRIRQEMAELRAERAREREELTLRQQQEAQTKAQMQYKDSLREEIATLAPHIAAKAKKTAFVERVYEIQQKHWNGHSTKSAEEAAEIAYSELYDDPGDAENTAASENTSRTPPGKGNPAKRVTTVSRTAPEPRAKPAPGSQELLEYHIRQAEREAKAG